MFRSTLATYLLVISLAGPNLCCCTLLRLMGTQQSVVTTGQSQAGLKPGCCHGRLARTSSEKRDRVKRDRVVSQHGVSKPEVPKDHCQCVRQVGSGIPTSRSDFVIQSHRSWLDQMSFQAATLLMFEVSDICPIVVHCSGTPPVIQSGREIHIDIHSWRC